jgi:hypothetical protein
MPNTRERELEAMVLALVKHGWTCRKTGDYEGTPVWQWMCIDGTDHEIFGDVDEVPNFPDAVFKDVAKAERWPEYEPIPEKPLPVFTPTGYLDNGVPVDYGTQKQWYDFWNGLNPARRFMPSNQMSTMAEAGWMLLVDPRNNHLVAIDAPGAPITVQKWCEDNLKPAPAPAV